MPIYGVVRSSDYLAHYGIKGQKKGIRRWTNDDGTLTEEGKRRYYVDYQGNIKKLSGQNLWNERRARKNYIYDKDRLEYEKENEELRKMGEKIDPNKYFNELDDLWDMYPDAEDEEDLPYTKEEMMNIVKYNDLLSDLRNKDLKDVNEKMLKDFGQENINKMENWGSRQKTLNLLLFVSNPTLLPSLMGRGLIVKRSIKKH